MTFHRTGGNAFLSIQSYHLDEATKLQLHTVSVASEQFLSPRVTNEEGKGHEQIYLLNIFFTAGWTGWHGVILSDPAIDWRLCCEGSIQGSITIMRPCTLCLTTEPV